MQATDLVLHWGVRVGKKEWVAPPKETMPDGTESAGDIAVETAFVGRSELKELNGDKVRLQELRLQIPAGTDITGVTFVMRSGDGSAWFRDGKEACLFELTVAESANTHDALHSPSGRHEASLAKPVLLSAGGSNFSIPVPGKRADAGGDPSAGVDDELSRRIIEAETSDQWTLMHRFNRAAELLGEALQV